MNNQFFSGKRQLLLLAALLSGILLISCAPSGNAITPGSAERREWTDSLGRTVMIPERVHRIAVTGPVAQTMVFALAPEMLSGYAVKWSGNAGEFLPEKFQDLPVFGQITGGSEILNPEELLQAAPDLIIDIGESGSAVAGELDSLFEKTGIPVVNVSMTMKTAGETFRELGHLLSLEEKAEEYAVYCERIYRKARGIAEKAAKKKILYVTETDGIHVIARNSYHSEILDMMAENAAVIEQPSSKGTGNEVDMEQMLLWDPEVLLFAPGIDVSGTVSDPEWMGLQAVRNGEIYQVPSGPCNWMGFPPGIQRILGMMWLSEILYPDQCDFELKEITQEYYRMFYHSELSDQQYRKLVGR